MYDKSNSFQFPFHGCYDFVVGAVDHPTQQESWLEEKFALKIRSLFILDSISNDENVEKAASLTCPLARQKHTLTLIISTTITSCSGSAFVLGESLVVSSGKPVTYLLGCRRGVGQSRGRLEHKTRKVLLVTPFGDSHIRSCRMEVLAETDSFFLLLLMAC